MQFKNKFKFTRKLIWVIGIEIHLRGSITWSPTPSIQKLTILHDVAEPKIRYLDVVLRVQQQVFKI
jgi:hypothetical protein